jgi:mannose-6-phosphate isomerase-like protein (cupin superfamily)
MTHKSVNLNDQFARFSDTWSPKIVGELNGQHVKLAKLEEDKCPWHSHDAEDEMFLIVEGTIDIQLRDGTVSVGPGEFYIVPKTVEHRVVPHGKVKLILFEPAGTAHTGAVRADITRDRYDTLIDRDAG